MLVQFFTIYCDAKGCAETRTISVPLHHRGAALIPTCPDDWQEIEYQHFCPRHRAVVILQDGAGEEAQAKIRAVCKAARLPFLAESFIAKGLSVDEVMERLIDEMAKRDDERPKVYR
jgi:hypothetical protein